MDPGTNSLDETHFFFISVLALNKINDLIVLNDLNYFHFLNCSIQFIKKYRRLAPNTFYDNEQT